VKCFFLLLLFNTFIYLIHLYAINEEAFMLCFYYKGILFYFFQTRLDVNVTGN